MKLFGKILYAIAVSLIGLLLFLQLWQIGARLIFKQELPSVLGWSQVIVLSGSMEPEFAAGDLLLIHKQDSYAVGDIVTFKENASFVTHRIIREEEAGFATQGDANNTEDGNHLKTNDIYGKVKQVVPRIGNFLLFLKRPAGMFCIVAAGVLIAAAPGIVQKMRRKEDA